MISTNLLHPILRANANLPVPSWVHDLALSKASDMTWAGRNDCPSHIAQALMAREVAAPEQGADYFWMRSTRMLRLATILVTRDDLSFSDLVDVAADDAIKDLVIAVKDKALTADHIIIDEERNYAGSEQFRYAKYLARLSQGGTVAMTAAEWMVTRRYSADTLVSVLAANVVKLGDNRRLLQALRSVTGSSGLGRNNLGYLCRHDSEHSTTNTECLYRALGQYDANHMMTVVPAWTVGWLDALEPEARVIALAVLDSGSAGSTMQTVTDAAVAVAGV